MIQKSYTLFDCMYNRHEDTAKEQDTDEKRNLPLIILLRSDSVNNQLQSFHFSLCVGDDDNRKGRLRYKYGID